MSHCQYCSPVIRILIFLSLLVTPVLVSATDLPPGFVERRLTDELTSATAMAFSPDGRLFVCQQSGQLRIIKNGALLSEPFLVVDTDDTGERGLLGVAFDPDFPTNGFVYVYYTVLASPRHNVVSRFTADGDHAVAGSEQMIFQLDDLSGATIHNGGAMHFGLDGKLYVAVGENGTPQNAQSLANIFGKILRLNKDGSIPNDNPFLDVTAGSAQAIWALGLRNPFTFDVQAQTGRIFINDVGESDWEEINELIPGANYGWPHSEGPLVNPGETAPLFTYQHGVGPRTGCAVTGGTFYSPSTHQFPSNFEGKYFFADFCSGWIRVFDPRTSTTENFATGLALPVDLKVGPDGSLYYLARGSDSVNQIMFTGSLAPFITSQPKSVEESVGESATFVVETSGDPPLNYQWQRDGKDIVGAVSSVFTVPSVRPEDNGAVFSVVVSNSFGSVKSDGATLTVTSNQPPVATINTPAEQTIYTGGNTINYSGVGQDSEDGVLPASAFTWQVDFHHDAHTHPFIPPTTGSQSGSFVIPVVGEKSANVWYRIRLSVTDSQGRTNETFRDILPRVAEVTITTEPAGLQVALDGESAESPMSFTGVAGIIRNISSEPLQSLDGTVYEFVGWSDGGALNHDISTPEANQTLTAIFRETTTAAQGSVQFSASSYVTSEADGAIQITVTRVGDLTHVQSVDYATSDDSATERQDFLPVFGTLNFAPNETQKTITILLTDGAVVEDDETFNISLFNTSGDAALGSPSIASIQIIDDDTDPSAANPIDNPEFFVRQHYQDFLNREPDAAGLEFWSNEIASCGTESDCLNIKRQNVSAAFFFSIEFQETGFLVYRLNRAAFARFPGFTESLRDTQELGRGVVVGVGDWQARLEANKAQFVDRFIEGPEFLSAFPPDLAPAEFVNRLDENSGFSLLPDEKELLIQQLEEDLITRVDVLRTIADDGDFRAREFNRAFVLFQYFGYLRRNPNDAPDDSFVGYEFWLNKLNQFNGNFERAQMVRAFLDSMEYRERFGTAEIDLRRPQK